MGWPKLLFLGWLGGLATAAAIGLAVVFGGLFDARASTPHLPTVAWAAHTAMIRYVRNAAGDVTPPARFSQAQVLAGSRDYDAHCAVCHGGPAVARAAWVEGMNPPPPYLLDAARQWTPAELFVISGQGVKMTGMPAWTFHRTDAQLWDLVAFLEALPRVTPADYQRLRQTQAVPPAPTQAVR
ncbi:MAG TPA: cytochrome c [Phenylobacterium sp.]|jgi:mono/diheme cytochrome c family protein|nr:cytochrome c [Phenylobacterium sp.]